VQIERRIGPFIAALASVVGLIAACGNRSSERVNPVPEPPLVESVVVTPSTATLAPGDTMRFQAEVRGRPDVAQTVIWSVDSQFSGDPGNIDQDGTYHAPRISRNPVQVKAISSLDQRKQGRSVVSFFPPVSFAIEPASAAVLTDATVQFRALITGVVNPQLRWSAAYGRIDVNGLYRAPVRFGSDLVDASVEGAGHVTIPIDVQRRAPVLETISGPAAPGEFVSLTGSYLTGGIVIFPAEQGPALRMTRARGSTSETLIRIEVPLGAASGPIQVETEGIPSQLPLLSNALTFQRAPRVLIRPERNELAARESVSLQIAWLGAPGPAPLTFDADVGSVAGSVYIAPAIVTGTRLAHVRACVTGSSNCSETTLVIRPFRVEPFPALVAAGGLLDLTARVGDDPVAATFELAAGGGSLSPDGHYLAPTEIRDTGQQRVVAEYAGSRAPAQVGVTGLSAGQLGRIADYVDHRRIDPDTFAPRSATTLSVAVTGGRAFVLRRMLAGMDQFGTSQDFRAYSWIDVYDLADPVRPRWSGAIEAGTRPISLLATPDRLYALSENDTFNGTANGSFAAYDLAGDLPVLVARVAAPGNPGPGWATPVFDSDRLIFFQRPVRGELFLRMAVQQLGSRVAEPPAPILLPMPMDAMDGLSEVMVSGATAAEDRAYARYTQFDQSFRRVGEGLAAWDLGPNPPVLLGSLRTDWTSPVFADLSIMGPLLFDVSASGMTTVYDRRAGVPVQITEMLFPPFRPFASHGSRFLVGTGWERASMDMLDLSNPVIPRLISNLEPGVDRVNNAVWIGNLVYAAQGLAGLGVYDASADGGPLPRSRLKAVPEAGVENVYAALIDGTYLYGTGAWKLSPDPRDPPRDLFAVWDISRSPATLVWRKPGDGPGYYFTGLALAISGGKIVRGTEPSLELWSIANPARPALLWSLPIGVNCVALEGRVAWVGTLSGHLVAFDLDAIGGPRELGRLSLGAFPSSALLVEPGRLAVALDAGGTGDLAIFDTTDPAAPARIGAAGLGVSTYAVAVEGSLAVVGTAAGLATVDLSELTRPVPIAIEPMPTTRPYGENYWPAPAVSAGFHDGIAWLGTAYYYDPGGLYGFDVRNPVAPRLVARGAEWNVFGLLFDGSRTFAYGAYDVPGVLELDLSQPRNVVTSMHTERDLQR
jgi:hypothetical protein